MATSSPPLKKRKLNNGNIVNINNNNNNDNTNDLSECIWCNQTSQNLPNTLDDNIELKCDCNALKLLLESSSSHKLIEINNSGNTNKLFQTYQLIRKEKENDNLFQINCLNGNIDFNSIQFKQKLFNSLNKTGIIILRNFFQSKQVLDARYDILINYLSEYVNINKNNKNITMKAKLNDNTSSPSLLSQSMSIVSNLNSVKNIVENSKLFEISSILLSSNHIITPSYKWLRSVPPLQFTGLHMDKMYFGLNSFKNMLSIWIPFGTIGLINGSLIWCYNSNKCKKWKNYLNQINYGNPNNLNNDGTHSGWITDKLSEYFNNDDDDDDDDIIKPEQKELINNNHSLLWCTTEFKAGDIAIFGLDLIHQTLRNDSDCYRISCDTRWQPQCQPLDDKLKKCGISKQMKSKKIK